MRFFTALSSLSLVSVLGACGLPIQETTRSSVDPLAFHQTADAALIEDQAAALNQMADQLVRRSTIRAAGTGALVTCGLAVATGGTPQSCIVGAAAGGMAGAAIGQVQGEKEVQNRVELVSADGLVRSIRGMNSQMAALEMGLPAVLAEQNSEFRDLQMRRDVGAVSPEDYTAGVAAIRDSRARITEALTLTIAQAKKAQENMENAASQGQSGLDWHLSATAQLAREAHSARSTISLLGDLPPAPQGQAALEAAPQENVTRALYQSGLADPVVQPLPATQLASNVQAPRTDLVTIKTTKRTRTPQISVAPRSGVLR